MFTFKNVRISDVNGIEISSAYVFNSAARKFFPWTWVTVYSLVLKYVLPGFMALVMLLQNERTATKLERYKGYVILLPVMFLLFLVFTTEFIFRCS